MITKTSKLAAAGISLSSVALAFSGTAALAHHPMGGATPVSFVQGLLSGIGHPMIGIDHLAFVIAAGIVAGFAGRGMLAPALFVVATIVGCMLRAVGGVELPWAEFVIAASVLAAGALAMSGRAIDQSFIATLFAAAGLFHGGAYAEAIIGAEATPLGAYLIGFAAIQLAIMATAMAATRMLVNAAESSTLQPRLAGAMMAGVGATFLLEHVERLMFPGM